MSKAKILSNAGSGVSGKAAKDAQEKMGFFNSLLPDKDGMEIVKNHHTINTAKEEAKRKGKKLNKDEFKGVKSAARLSGGIQGYYKGWDKVAGRGMPQKEADEMARKVARNRIGATIAGAGALAVGPRVLSGGDLASNNRGERDIAGIPFV